jgi:2-C-methyl-D-erythritol 2,4-cyclodiphosphate synthase
VLLHAITDALLGAAGLGDIGTHFPDTDERFSGADSAVLLAEAARRVREAGWQVGNRGQHRDRAGAASGTAHRGHARIGGLRHWALATDQVNIKAKTAEKLGPVGQGLSIEARAVVLLTALTRQGPIQAWVFAA